MGDLNTHIGRLRYSCKEELVTIIAAHFLEYQAQHFLPRRRYGGTMVWTWYMWREGRLITVLGDCIFSSYRRNFLNVGVRETQLTNNHRMVLVCL